MLFINTCVQDVIAILEDGTSAVKKNREETVHINFRLWCDQSCKPFLNCDLQTFSLFWICDLK